MAQVVERDVHRDPAQPSTAITRRVEARSCAVHTPKCLDAQVLSGGRIADDANDPAIDIPLILPKERFEGVQVARGEPLGQVHRRPLYRTYCTPVLKVTFLECIG